MERDQISIRTKNALAESRRQILGRPVGSKNKNAKLDPNKEQIARLILLG
jgi:DNA invertase Pin-like site-specific DNA recombinase